MHKGRNWPHALDLRVYCGQWTYPSWLPKKIRWSTLTWHDPRGYNPLTGVTVSEEAVAQQAFKNWYWRVVVPDNHGIGVVVLYVVGFCDPTNTRVDVQIGVYDATGYQGQVTGYHDLGAGGRGEWNNFTPAVANPTYPNSFPHLCDCSPEGW